MSDLVLEILRAVVLLVILISLLRARVHHRFFSDRGWRFILIGFGLLLFGSLLDITDNFDSLNRFVIIGDTPVQAFLEKMVGFLGGFLMLSIGLQKWLPTVASVAEVKRLADEVSEKNRLLERMLILRESAEIINRHDLKGPLGNIIAYVQFLSDGTEEEPVRAELVGNIERSAYDMLEMINRSQDLMKMEMGTYHLKPEPVNLLRVIERVDRENKTRREALLIPPLEIRVDGNPPRNGSEFFVRGEELLCYSMCSSLIRNAIEASPPDHPVTVSLEKGEKNTIRIHNTGIVPEEVRDRFFEKYATAGKEGGTGLGTYSARLIAETLGGQIHMDTSEERGTRVSVLLPG